MKDHNAPSGHLSDGSSVQKHSAGEVYPYVRFTQGNGDPHAKYADMLHGLIGPGLPDGGVVCRSVEHRDALAQQLKRAHGQGRRVPLASIAAYLKPTTTITTTTTKQEQ